jgi:hypothetical protein
MMVLKFKKAEHKKRKKKYKKIKKRFWTFRQIKGEEEAKFAIQPWLLYHKNNLKIRKFKKHLKKNKHN